MKDDSSYFDSYHQLQYDRIDKLETKRENFCNYIITITSGIFAITFNYLDKLDLKNSIFIFLFVLIINSISIIFICKTRPLIKMHQNRARLARKDYLGVLGKINDLVPKPESSKDYFRRDLIYTYLHIIMICFFATFLLFNCNSTNEIKKNMSISITASNKQ